MADYEALTALIDVAGLKKEGKVTVVDSTPGLVVNKKRVEGVMPIVSHLGSKEPSLLGDSTLEKALVRQWVNFQFGCLDLADRRELWRQLRSVDSCLENSTFLAGEQKTAADILLFHGIHSAVSKLDFQEKERCIHLSRWFRALQQDPKLRRGKKLVTFSRTRLY